MSSSFVANEKIVETIIKAGGNINAIDIDGRTPIFYAILNGKKIPDSALKMMGLTERYSKKMFKETLNKHFIQPPVNLHTHTGEKILQLLLNNGANINAVSKSGSNPYKHAMDLGKI